MNRVFDSIQEDIDWRLAELNIVRGILDSLEPGDFIAFNPESEQKIRTDKNQYEREAKVILRSTIPIIYAHWEGFVVSSIKTVFTYLNELKLNNEDYCCTYLTTAYGETLKSLDKSSNFDKRRKHLTNLYVGFSKQVNLPLKIDTKSNLKFDVLTDICKKTNLNIATFKKHKDKLDQLVSIRNSISHGENSHVFYDYSDIVPYIDLLENLMFDFQCEIKNLLQNEKYKKDIDNEQSI